MSALSAVDARGVRLTLERAPQRIVSLVPSTTETFFALGAGTQLVGRTRYCVHPQPEVARLAEVGGTKALAWSRLEALRPDLIVANSEENKPEFWERLVAIAPLWVAFPRTLAEAVEDLRDMAVLVGRGERGEELAGEIETARVAARAAAEPGGFSYAYLVWREPYMVVSDDTFIARMLAEVGGRNVFAEVEPRYASVTLEQLIAADPERVLLSSEPYDFGIEHADELGPLAERCRLVDGELCSWHGARMRRAFETWAATPLGC